VGRCGGEADKKKGGEAFEGGGHVISWPKVKVALRKKTPGEREKTGFPRAVVGENPEKKKKTVQKAKKGKVSSAPDYQEKESN